MRSAENGTVLVDLEPSTLAFLADVTAGLRESPKSIPCKYFYDQIGSQLFDRICELDEYYLTRTELEIMTNYAGDMAHHVGTDAMLIEFGSGSSIKTRLLLDHLRDPVAYVPVDISKEHLAQTADRLSADYPTLQVLPVCADFTEPIQLPIARREPRRKTVYFPGSTIGNFESDEALALLGHFADVCGPGGGLLIGIDLQKDTETLEAAYNDGEGVTADFNLNLLRRINNELGADFDLDAFDHQAEYSVERGRIEIGLVSKCRQTVTVDDECFQFEEGEEIRTEYSHKYTIDAFGRFALEAGFRLQHFWTDDMRRFAILYLTALE
jgi:dimethylhistidine N-methyltransferase